MTEKEIIKGYKVFNSDFTCRGFQYKVGKTFTHKGNIEICSEGFHFCKKLNDCFNYYDFDSNNKVAEIHALGDVKDGDNKSVTNKIKIIKELSWHEVLELVNTGLNNTGNCNTGDCNTGNCNTGDCNTGNCNTGNCNTGYRNTGNCNTGNCNTGLFNSCDYSNGLFNSQSPKIYMFNKPTKLTFEEFQEKYPEAYSLLCWTNLPLTQWIEAYNMTEEEKKTHPEYTTANGYLKRIDYKEACQKMWDSWTKTERNKIKKLPNFDKDIFEEITGIEV